MTKPKYPVVDIDEYIKKLVDEAPPLDSTQRARLSAILRPHVNKPKKK